MICEGQLVPHSHSTDVSRYLYLNWTGEGPMICNLCSRCVKFDRAQGFIMEKVVDDE